jgi:hypothetical protein
MKAFGILCRRYSSTCPTIVIPTKNIIVAFQHIRSIPEIAIPTIAWNITTMPHLLERGAAVLTDTLDILSRSVALLKKPIILGALQVIVNESAVLLTDSISTIEKKQLFYPRSFNAGLIPFAEKYFRHNKISLSIRETLSNPNEMYVRFYKKTPVSTDYFGKYWHKEIVESALDPKVVKFEEPMSDYVMFYRFRILNDLVRGSFVTYPSNLAYFNEQLRIIELMFSKTALSAEESQNLLRGALNAALYGCEDYAHVEETIELVQKEKDEVSKGLKRISKDIELHGKKYGFALPQSFVPNATDFVIHTSFKDRVLSNVRSERGQDV